VHVALRMDSYLKREPTPESRWGCIAPEEPMRYLPRRGFSTRPEAAHLNTTGVSGLATKTTQSSGCSRRCSNIFRRIRMIARRLLNVK